MNVKSSSSPRGQVLIIFAGAFVVVIMMLALLFDGARGVVLRRELQDASDSAALAAANIIQAISPKGCSASAGPPPGAPQASVVAAAKASVATNIPGYDLNTVVVSCVSGWPKNNAVQVTLGKTSETFFGSIFGIGPMTVGTASSAINGQTTVNNYSVVELDPSNLSWPNGLRGCPSFLLSGGPTVNFDSSIYIDSSCSAANGGAFSTNGNAASVTMGAGAAIRIVGEYKPTALTVTPAPIEHSLWKNDPLGFLANSPPPISSMPVQSASRMVLGGGSTVLEPGVYVGGIQLKNKSKAFLHPGIYVMKGASGNGGLDLGAQSEVYAIPTAKTSTTQAQWPTDCVATNCGVLIYYLPETNAAAGEQITVAAGAVFMVRAYNPDLDTSAFKNDLYRNLLIWQDANPVPSPTWAQPIVSLSGGGGVVMSGTVYTPSAGVTMGGNAGGSGGSSIDLTLQFITWDLTLSGNSSFHFIYQADSFTQPLDYGLIE